MKDKLNQTIYKLQAMSAYTKETKIESELKNVISLLEDMRDYCIVVPKENLLDKIEFENVSYSICPAIDIEEICLKLNLRTKYAYTRGSLNFEQIEEVKAKLIGKLIEFLED